MFSWQEFAERFRVAVAALGVHALMVALVVLGTMNWQPFRTEKPTAISIEAVIVDTSEIKRQRDEARRAVEMEDRRRQRAEELERQRQRELEERLQKEEEAARRQRELDAQKKRDAQDRLQALRMQRERQLEDERLKQQRELEQLRAQREAAERQRDLEEERLKQIEARADREREENLRQQRQAQLQAQADAQAREFRAGQLATLNEQYYLTIQAMVTQNWLRPPTAQPGLRCVLKIVQIPGGEVITAAIAGSCNADEATRRSIIAAVERGGALPYRGYEDVFQREINFTFIYDGD